MRYPHYIVFNADWTQQRLVYSPKGLKATTGRVFDDATSWSVSTLLENFVLPITITARPSAEWQDVVGAPSVVVDGDFGQPETLSAALVWSVVPLALDDAKSKLKEKAKLCKFQRMDAGVEFDLDGQALIAQTDGESRSLLMATYFKALSGGLPDGRKWRFRDNSYPLLTSAQIIDLGNAVDAMVSACYDQQDLHDAAIDSLPDLDACMAYDCSAGYPPAPSLT